MQQRRLRKRRTRGEIFLAALNVQSGEEQKLISNSALRSRLGWSEERYARIKRQLVGEKKVIVGGGRGGSVRLATAQGNRSINVFIAYSHVDEDLKERLVRHLEPLKQLGLVEAWHDR